MNDLNIKKQALGMLGELPSQDVDPINRFTSHKILDNKSKLAQLMDSLNNIKTVEAQLDEDVNSADEELKRNDELEQKRKALKMFAQKAQENKIARSESDATQMLDNAQPLNNNQNVTNIQDILSKIGR